MPERLSRRALKIVELSPFAATALLAVALFSLPLTLASLMIQMTAPNSTRFTPADRAASVALYYEQRRLANAGTDTLAGAVQASWPLTAIRQNEFFSAHATKPLRFSTDATPFAPIAAWESTHPATVWAWVVTAPAEPGIVASATGNPAYLRAAEANYGSLIPSGARDSASAAADGLLSVFANPSQAPTAGLPALSPGDVGPGGGSTIGDQHYQMAWFNTVVSGRIWHYYIVGPGLDPQATGDTIELPARIAAADPTAPGFTALLKSAARETGYTFFVAGPYAYSSIPLRAPAGTSIKTAENLGHELWPAWETVGVSKVGATTVRELTPGQAQLAGGRWATAEYGSGEGSAYGTGAQPQSVIYVAIWRSRPGGEPSFWQQLIFDWRVFVASWFPWLVGTIGLLFVLSLGAAPVAFAYERRLVARERLCSELERMRLDAHDKVYNRLSALSKRVALAAAREAQQPPDQMTEVAEDIRSTVAELQGILGQAATHGDAGLARIPLEEQLAAVAAAQSARLRIRVPFAAEAQLPELPGATGWDLQCVLEEALTNAARHGDATEARVTLGAENGALTLSVADNGHGKTGEIDIVHLPADSTGLRGMAARLKGLGGSLRVSTGPEGTTLTVSVPLQPPG